MVSRFFIKALLFILFYILFVYYVVFSGATEYLLEEQKAVRIEIQSYIENNNLKPGRGIPLEALESIRKKYRENNNQQKGFIEKQKKRLHVFSIITFFATLISVFYLNAGYLYIGLYILPFLHYFNQLYSKTNTLYFDFILFPSVALLMTFAIRYFWSKAKGVRLD